MSLIIRSQTPADYYAIAELEQSVFSYTITPHDVASQAAKNPLFTAVVAEWDGQIVGRAAAGMMHAHTPEGDMRCSVAVATDLRFRGIGAALWDALQPALQERRPSHLRANGNGAAPESLAWAERRGFRPTHRHLFQALDLTAFDPGPWQERIAELQAEGYRFVPFSELRSPEAEHRFHALEHAYTRDTPSADESTYLEFDAWRAWAFESDGAWPEGWMVLVAPDGDWAGLTLMQKRQDGATEAHIFLTGVSAPYRGKGLSVPLKVAAVLNAASHGMTRLTTLNHAANERILAANRTLGFRVEEDVIRLVKRCNWE